MGVFATLITDASYGMSTKLAGWGAWAKADGGRGHTWLGPVLNVGSAAEAELGATLEGYKQVRKLWPECSVLLQSDCQRALMLLRWRFSFAESTAAGGMHVAHKHDMNPTLTEAEILAHWAEVWHHQGLVMVRHVKGHTERNGDANSGRYWVNREVDRLAREAMRLQRTGASNERPEAGADR